MADELAGLTGALSVIDEDDVRVEVEALVAAQSTKAALEDEQKLKNAWKTLQAAEEAVARLKEALAIADRNVAAASSGVFTMLGGNGESGGSSKNNNNKGFSGGSSPAAGQAAAAEGEQQVLQLKLRRAERELNQREQVLRTLRQQVNVRKAQRLAEARKEVAAAAAAVALEEERKREGSVAAIAAASGSSQVAGGVGGVMANSASHHRQRCSLMPAPVGKTSLSARMRAAQKNTAVVAPAHSALHLQPHRRPGAPISATAYSGGEVLPSLCRVHVTRRELREKHNRYEDDTDVEVYRARQQKRARLEAAEALVRVKQQEAATTQHVVQYRKKDEGHVGDEGISVRVVKREEEEGETRVVNQQQPHAPMRVSGGEAASQNEPQMIDVDALMEDEEDVSEELLQRLMAERTPPAQEASSSVLLPGSALVGIKREASIASSLYSGEFNTEEDGSAAVVQPRDPDITLMPGIYLGMSVYTRLLDYQQEGLRWLLGLHAERTGGILGDEMGLGKTIQVAALLNALTRSHQLRGPALIVCPVTVLRQWVAELHRWAPYVRVCVMHETALAASGISKEGLIASVVGTPAVVLTTYSALRMSCTLLHTGGFQYVILDEGHKICNPEAGVTLAAKSFATPHRLILSGSPIQNSLKELWCLFDFVRPGLLGSLAKFVEEFETPIAQSRNIRATSLALATAVECAKTLQSHIAPYLLRRLKRGVSTSLPRKYERVIRVPLSDQQLEQYVEIVSSPEVQKLIRESVYYPQIAGGLNRDGRDASGSLHVAGRSFNLMAANRRNNAGVRLEAFRVMNRLRQVCNHADFYAVHKGKDEEDRLASSHTSARYLAGGDVGRGHSGGSSSGTHKKSLCFRSNNAVNVEGSAKMRVLRQMLRQWHRDGHRVLIFSQTRMMLDILENFCEQENYRYIRMDGTTNSHHRQELMDRFNEDDSILAALLTTRVGGIGVNLIGADRVVIFDPDWNPVTDVQARERAWRIGQTRDVCVYRLISSGTVEEAILRRQLAKTYVTDKVLKDPTLQRFFRDNDSFVENFFLGSEYDARVPRDRKYVVAAQEILPGAASAYADDPGGEQQRDMERDEVNGSPTMRRPATRGAPAGAVQDSTKSEAAPAGKPEDEGDDEHEFGELIAVTEEDGRAAAFTIKQEDENVFRRGPGSSPRVLQVSSSATAGQQRNLRQRDRGENEEDGDEATETTLLQSLVDGQDVVVTGSDRVAQRLARVKAEQTMLRVTNQTTRTLLDQQREFSLLWAAEQKKVKEEADKAEQGRYYAEEMALASKGHERMRRRNM